MTTETTAKHEFTIFVNNVEFHTPEHVLTGLQLKQLASVPADYELFEVKGETSVPIANEDKVHIHEKAHFRAIPAGTFGNQIDAPGQAR
jgi:Multiubiquitin